MATSTKAKPKKQTKTKTKREYQHVSEQPKDEPWLHTVLIDPDNKANILKESKRRDDCKFGKVINERLRQAFKSKPEK